MTRRNEFAALIVELLDRSGPTPLHLQLIYEQIADTRPDLVDHEPDPHAPNRPKWQHDVRWELQSAVTAGRISKRSDIGRGFYSRSGASAVASTAEPSSTLGPVESARTEPVDLRAPPANRQAWREEGLLVSRYAHWARARGRTIGRLEIRTPEGDRLVADAFEPERSLLIEAKSASLRSSMRMAVGQLLDYAQNLTGDPHLAVLVPESLSPSVQRFVARCGVGTIVETSRGEFDESLVAADTDRR